MGALMGNTLMKGTSAGCGRGGSGPGGSGRRAAGLRALGLGAVVLLGLSACSGTPEVPAQTSISLGTPSTLASTTPSPSASPSPSATASPSNAYEPATSTSPAKNVPKPVMPALAKEKTFEGQKAFIKYWFETHNYAFETGETDPFRAVSAPDCPACKTIIGGAEKMWTSPITWRVGSGTAIDLRTAKARKPMDGLDVVDVRAKDPAISFWTADGQRKDYKPTTASTGMMRLWLEYVDGHWRAVDLRKIAP